MLPLPPTHAAKQWCVANQTLHSPGDQNLQNCKVKASTALRILPPAEDYTGWKLVTWIVSGLCCFSMEKNGVTVVSQRVQEMCFTAAWLYPGGDRDSHKLEKPQRRGAPVGTVLTGARLWGVGKKPGLLGIWPYKQKTIVMLYRAYWRWARSRGVSFQGGSNQPPGCHLPGMWTGYSTFPCDIENFPRGVLAQRGPEWELEQASRPLWSIPSDRL